MPHNASWHGLADPFEPVEALRHWLLGTTDLVTLDLRRQPTMQVQAESAPG